MVFPKKLNGWQWAFAALCVLWLARVIVVAMDDYPSIEASANATFDDVTHDDLVLHDVPAVSTDDEIAGMYDRIRQDLASDSAAGRQTASSSHFSETMVVDLTVHAADHSWLENQLSGISDRAWRRAYVGYALTWLAVWVVPVLAVGFAGWGVGRLRRRHDM